MLVKLGEIYARVEEITGIEPVQLNGETAIDICLKNGNTMCCARQVKQDVLYPSMKELADIVNTALQSQSYGNPDEKPEIPPS